MRYSFNGEWYVKKEVGTERRMISVPHDAMLYEKKGGL